jgi:hypothetical protein
MAVKEQLAALLAYGTDGSAFGARTQLVQTAGQVTTIAQGFWMIELPTANSGGNITFTPDAGTSTVVYLNGTSAKTQIFSDGFSWFLSPTAAATYQITQIKAMF